MTEKGDVDIKVTITIPANLAGRRSREWFRSEFTAACLAHLPTVRQMLEGPPKRIRKSRALPGTPVDTGTGSETS